MKRRVVVTGLGIVSSIGIGKDEFWNNLIAGKSGISDITIFDASEYDAHRGGEIREFEPQKIINDKILKGMGKASQFAVIAAKLALDDSGVNKNNIKRASVIIGSTMGDIQTLEQIVKYWIVKGEDYIFPFHVPKYPANNLANQIAFYFNLQFLNMVIPTACSAGNYSIGFAYDLIRGNKIDMALVGGSDVMSRANFAGFNRLTALSPDKCQPFDRNRKGILIGEGAGIMVLESLESARRRGANIYAEVLGYGLSCDANNMTAPRIEGIVKVMQKAIKNSSVKKEDVGYISAHGTGTPANDKAECQAVKKVFGNMLKNIPISSIKSMIGHTMGAASAIEAISCCLTIKENIIPPTINYETPDPECDINCVPNIAENKKVKVALNNSFAFGGNNACVVFGAY